MAKVKAAHHRGTHQVRARAVVDAANRDPMTRCWRCGLTLAEHPKHKTGKRARWTGGHVIDGQVGGLILPEASTCNFTHGARLGNQRQRRTPDISRTW